MLFGGQRRVGQGVFDHGSLRRQRLDRGARANPPPRQRDDLGIRGAHEPEQPRKARPRRRGADDGQREATRMRRRAIRLDDRDQEIVQPFATAALQHRLGLRRAAAAQYLSLAGAGVAAVVAGIRSRARDAEPASDLGVRLSSRTDRRA